MEIPDMLRHDASWHQRLEQAAEASNAQAAGQIARRRVDALERGLVAGALALAAFVETSRITPERRDLLQVLEEDELQLTRDIARRMTRVMMGGGLVAHVIDGAAPRVEVHPVVAGPPVLRVRAGAPRYGWMQQEAAHCEVTGYVPGDWEEHFLAAAARAGEAILAAGLMRARAHARDVWGDLWEGAPPVVVSPPQDDAAPLADTMFES